MIAVRELEFVAGQFRLEGITFDVPAGSYAVLMGRTGCGKTTILEAICGLRSIRSGTIILHGEDVTRLKAADRGIGYVPQDLALFPTMTVSEHLSFALRIRRAPAGDIARRVDELAQMLGIGPLLERKPTGLSGGEAQRVALGRALSARPTVLCLDEPLSALDEGTREDLSALIRNVQQVTGITVLHVTHNRSEAKRLADRILILERGKVREAASEGNGETLA